MKTRQPAAQHTFDGDLPTVLEFLKRTRSELRMLRTVVVWSDRLRIVDVNRDCFEILGIGYPDAEVRAVLDALNAAYKPESVHDPIAGDFKEFRCGRERPWAQDRVM